jgi:uncharacterized membrane protein
MISKSDHCAYIIILGCVALWCAALLVPPFVAHIESPSQDLSRIAYRCFSPICHQYEARSLTIFGHKLAVCARCSGIYFGALIGVLLYPLVRFSKHWSLRMLWIIAGLPMLIDVVLDMVGVHASSIGTRLATGSFFGIASAGILLPIAIEAVRNILSHLSNQQGAQYETKAR